MSYPPSTWTWEVRPESPEVNGWTQPLPVPTLMQRRREGKSWYGKLYCADQNFLGRGYQASTGKEKRARLRHRSRRFSKTPNPGKIMRVRGDLGAQVDAEILGAAGQSEHWRHASAQRQVHE
eukprot:scaffold1295_cov220-Pinguiococcus_pyrenoidosus.AAC.5